MPDDWFAQNAPKPASPSSSGSDWFAQNAASQSSDVPAQPDDDSGFHPLNSLAHGIQGFWDRVSPVTAVQGMNQAIQQPVETVKGLGQQNVDLWNKAKDAWDKGDHLNAIRHGINYALNGIPGIGTSIDEAGDQFAAGDYSGGAGSSLGIGTNLALTPRVPAAVRAVGRGLKNTAVPIAEGALGVRAIQRAYGKTPGLAILEETQGFRPVNVAASARKRMGDLTTALETSTAASTTPASLAPARNILTQRAASAAAGNSGYTPGELAEMQEQLTKPRPGFAGQQSYPPGANTPITISPKGQVVAGTQPPMTISELQDPATILRMKREFGNDFTKWNPLHPQREMGTARQVYRALDNELDRTVPGAQELNQRISSLIPVAQRAEETDLHAGIGERIAHRVGAHTGALTGTALGYRAGGPIGAAVGLVAPEVATAAPVRMGVARGLYGAGKTALKPNAGRAAAGIAAAGTALRNPYRDE